MKWTCLPLLLAAVTFAHAQEWSTDHAAVLAQAKKENKAVLIDFTGSDWCGACIRLEKEIFSTREFKTFAAEKLVLLKVDFPRRPPLSDEQQEKNEQLAQRYGFGGSFPTLMLLNANGNKIGQIIGYDPNGVQAFLDVIDKRLQSAKK